MEAPSSASSTPTSVGRRRHRKDGGVDQRSHPLSYTAIAEAVGASRTHVSRVLRGRSGVSKELAEKMAGLLGVKVEEFLAQVEKARDEKEWERRSAYNKAYGVARRRGHENPAKVAREAAAR